MHVTIRDLFDEALRHHNAGRLAEAERLYREILARESRHADSLHMLGAIALQVGRNLIAIDLIGQAIAINGDEPIYRSNRGNALHKVGRSDEALADLRSALVLCPDFADAYSNHGNVLKDNGRPEEALRVIEAALRIEPSHPAWHYNRGNILKSLSRFEEAIAAYDAATLINPGFAQALVNKGDALSKLGRPAEALAALNAALRINVDLAEAHSNRGIALHGLRRLEEALASYEVVLRLKPDLVEAHNNRGNAFKEMGRLAPALASYDAALCLRPDFAEAYSNRGNILSSLGRMDEAIASYDVAVHLRPDLSEAHSNLLLGLQYGSEVEDETIRTATRRFGDLFKPVSPSFTNTPDPERRLRIGYVSGDLGRHSVSFFLTPVLANHDPAVVEIFCYSTRDRDDDRATALRASADHWRSLVGLSDQVSAALVRGDAIDILVDLSGHTASNRLPVFACKPAPVQVTWLGFPATTGLNAMDYRLVDAITDPKGEEDCSETLIRLPNGFLCFDPPAEAPDISPSPDLNGIVTFGSFNNSAKLSRVTLDAWAALFARLPQARLLLKDRSFSDLSARALMLERLRSCGISSDRVDLLDWEPDPAGHLSLYRRIDIALDPFPYNGTTTTCEALWMGVPVVTLEGTRHSGRVGASLLTRLGLESLIAPDVGAYVDIAAGLAIDRKGLSDLRRGLRSRMAASSLCDGQAFTRELEASFRAVWRDWCVGKAGYPRRH